MKRKPFDTIIIISDNISKNTIKTNLFSKLNLGVLPEIIPLSAFDPTPLSSSKPYVHHILNRVISNIQQQTLTYTQYLQKPGARKKLLETCCYLYNEHKKLAPDHWISPIYELFISEVMTEAHKTATLPLSYLQQKNCIFIGFNTASARNTHLIKKCISSSQSASIQLSSHPRAAHLHQALQHHFKNNITFPSIAETQVPSIFHTNCTLEEHEYDYITQLCTNATTTIRILCPNESYLRMLKIYFEKHSIDADFLIPKPVIHTPLAQLFLHFLDVLKTPTDLHRYQSFFAHPISQTVLSLPYGNVFRSDILSQILRFFENNDADQWTTSLDQAKDDFKTYLTSMAREDYSFATKEIPHFIDALEQLNTIVGYVTTCLKEKETSAFPEYILSTFLTLITPSFEHIPHMIHDWLKLKAILTEFNTHFIEPESAFHSEPYLSSLTQTLLSQTIPYKASYKKISAQLWSSLPLYINDTVIIAGFNHTSWNTSKKENEFIPDNLKLSFEKDNAIHLDDIHHFLIQTATFNTTFLVSSQRNKSGFLLPHPLLHRLKKETTLSPLRFTPLLTKKHSQPPLPLIHKPAIQFSSPESRARLTHFIQSTSFSSSQLETYQKCPYHYLLTYLLGYISASEITEGISGAEWGTILHKMLYDAYTTLAKQHITAPHHPQFEDAFLEQCHRTFSQYQKNSLHWDIKQIQYFGDDIIRGILPYYIQIERDQFFSLYPELLECKLEKKIVISPTLTISLKGIIDAVLSDGDRMAVIDYKSGSTLPNYKQIQHFHALQLSIYMYLVQSTFKEKTVHGGIYIQLHPKTIEKKVMITTEYAKKNIFGLSRQRPFIVETNHWTDLEKRIKTIITHIQEGQFSPEPNPDLEMGTVAQSKCTFCDYKRYCRYSKRYSTWH